MFPQGRPREPRQPGESFWLPPKEFFLVTALKPLAWKTLLRGKEEIFFALLEKWVWQRIDSVRAALREQKTPRQKLAALRKYYAEIAKDRRVVLISLEFKLFALRHPEAHARLQDRHRRLRAMWGELVAELLEALGRTLPISNTAASAACSSLAQGLLLEQLVDPKTLSEKDVRHILGLFFDSVFRGN